MCSFVSLNSCRVGVVTGKDITIHSWKLMQRIKKINIAIYCCISFLAQPYVFAGASVSGWVGRSKGIC